jgi:hypothetical protein
VENGNGLGRILASEQDSEAEALLSPEFLELELMMIHGSILCFSVHLPTMCGLCWMKM